MKDNKKEINLEEIAEKLKDRVLFPKAVEEAKKFIKNIVKYPKF